MVRARPSFLQSWPLNLPLFTTSLFITDISNTTPCHQLYRCTLPPGRVQTQQCPTAEWSHPSKICLLPRNETHLDGNLRKTTPAPNYYSWSRERAVRGYRTLVLLQSVSTSKLTMFGTSSEGEKLFGHRAAKTRQLPWRAASFSRSGTHLAGYIMGYAHHDDLQVNCEQRLDVWLHERGAKQAVSALPNLLSPHNIICVSCLLPTATMIGIHQT